MKKDNVIVDKSKAFALRIINLYKYLCEEKHEYILSKQATIWQMNNLTAYIPIALKY